MSGIILGTEEFEKCKNKSYFQKDKKKILNWSYSTFCLSGLLHTVATRITFLKQLRRWHCPIHTSLALDSLDSETLNMKQLLNLPFVGDPESVTFSTSFPALSVCTLITCWNLIYSLFQFSCFELVANFCHPSQFVVRFPLWEVLQGSCFVHDCLCNLRLWAMDCVLNMFMYCSN